MDRKLVIVIVVVIAILVLCIAIAVPVAIQRRQAETSLGKANKWMSETPLIDG